MFGKRIRVFILTAILLVSQLITGQSIVYADAESSYSWNDIYAGVLGDTPALNMITGESEFLYAKEAADNTEYQNTDIAIGNDEKSFWILAQIHNDNLNEAAVAKDVKLSMSVEQVTGDTSVISATVTSSNSEPYTLTDTFIFTASEPYHLEYVTNSTYVYSWIDGVTNTMHADGQPVSDEGIALGYTMLDGNIPGGKYVTVSIKVNVVRDSDIQKLHNSKQGKATIEMWNLIQTCSDPTYFLNEYHEKISQNTNMRFSGNQYKKLVKVAKKKTKECKNDYEKMEVLCRYIANRIYYDFPYYNGLTSSTNLNPYDIWKNKKSVCQGYSNLYWTMLDAVGIPCMLVYGEKHAFNAAYDTDSKRWIFIDVTWCSGNRYENNGEWVKGQYNSSYFDMDLNFLLSITNHELLGVEGVLKKNVYYEMTPGYGDVGKKGFLNNKKWHWTAVSRKGKKSKVKLVKKISGYKVKEIGYAAFYNKPNIKTVYIPSTVTKIGDFAFALKEYKQTKTKIISSISKAKLTAGHSWWGRRVTISRK